VAPSVTAGGYEISASVGAVAPLYSQSFIYDLGRVRGALPFVSITGTGSFGLSSRRSVAFGFGVTRRIGRRLALEARIDDLSMSVRTTPMSQQATLTVPGLPRVTQDLEVPPGEAKVTASRSLSLDLEVSGPTPSRRWRWRLSGGISYLTDLDLSVRQSLAVQPPWLGSVSDPIRLPATSLEASFSGRVPGRLGLNLGLGAGRSLGRRLAVRADGRFFHVASSRTAWRRAEISAPPMGALVLDEIDAQFGALELPRDLFVFQIGLVFAP
jgi:hypothetical protein